MSPRPPRTRTSTPRTPRTRRTTRRTNTPSIRTAYFAGGCFWGLEHRFRSVQHVLRTRVGFMGDTRRATYEEVCAKQTKHAETVEVTYDARRISFARLVKAFFSFHDPTTRDKQGPDVGAQYRSIAFYSNPREKRILCDCIRQWNAHSSRPMVTEVVHTMPFFEADEVHQQYYEKRGR